MAATTLAPPALVTQDQTAGDPPFQVQDRRRKGFFTLDNELLDRYGAILGACGIAVYTVLARFANQESECFPAQSTIARLTGMSRMQVSRELHKLRTLNLLEAEHQFAPNGSQRSNLYILLDLPPVTESYTPSNTPLHPPVTESYTPSNTPLHLKNNTNINNTQNEQDLHQQRRHRRQRPRRNTKTVAEASPDVVVALLGQGIAEKVAQRLAQHYSQEYIVEKLGYLAFLRAERPQDVKKPAAWLRKAIEDNYNAPDGFVPQDEREQLQHEAQQETARYAEQAKEALQIQQASREAATATQAARQQHLRDEYGTKDEDIEFWNKARQELRYTTYADTFALVAEAEILKCTEDTALIGVEGEAKWRQLQHPGTKKAIQRALSQVASRPMELQVVNLEKAL